MDVNVPSDLYRGNALGLRNTFRMHGIGEWPPFPSKLVTFAYDSISGNL